MSLGTELSQDRTWLRAATRTWGLLGFFFFSDLPCGSRCCVGPTVIVRWCFNGPRPRTWADQNHMFLQDCVCGLVKTVLRPESWPPPRMRETFSPSANSGGWCNITSKSEWNFVFSLTQGFWGDRRYGRSCQKRVLKREEFCLFPKAFFFFFFNTIIQK